MKIAQSIEEHQIHRENYWKNFQNEGKKEPRIKFIMCDKGHSNLVQNDKV